MTEANDDAVRDLVQRAYAADPEPLRVDVTEGLRDVLDRAGRLNLSTATVGPDQTTRTTGRSRATTRAAESSVGADRMRASLVPQLAQGTIVAMTIHGRITVSPCEGRTILFGRNESDVHIGIGVNDRRVGRLQGKLTYRDDRW